MGKKKNRKKELKRQQKLDVKLISEYEALFMEAGLPVPTFVERRLIQSFDEQHTAMMQETNDFEIEPDMEKINRELQQGTFKWDLDHALFQEALNTSNPKKRQQKFREVLEVNPDYFVAEYQLFISDLNGYELASYQKALDFEEYTLSKWKATGYRDWYVFSTRPILTAMMFLIVYYTTEGFYYRALKLVDAYLAKRPQRFPPNFVFYMLSLYHLTGQEHKVEKFYQDELKQGRCKDEILIHAVIAAFLSGRVTEASQLFAKLVELNDDTLILFSRRDWIDELMEIEAEECYIPNSRQSLQASLYPLIDLLEHNYLLTEFLKQEAAKYATPSPKSYLSDEVDRFLAIQDLKELYRFRDEPEMEGIRMDYIRIFMEAGIQTAKDFAQKTEKEILALKGIGAVTVKRLKENGIVFKK